MKIAPVTAIVMLVSFCATVVVAALVYTKNFPVLAFAGEDSVATWLSGALLVFSASLCFFLSLTQQRHPWLLLAAFFITLALDERFMFHERIKEWILFSSGTRSRWLYELPVLLGAGVGLFVTFILWRHTSSKSKVLIVAAMLFGSGSVIIDVLAAGVLWEECFKLLGEMCLACALVMRVARTS